MSQATISAGRRMSTARCYLDPIRARPNLRIETGALTQAVVIEGRRCVGVRYAIGADIREARAAGKLSSVRLHQLPTVAGTVRHRPARTPARTRHRRAPRLTRCRREPTRSLRPRTRWAIGAKGITFNDRARGIGMVGQALRYAFFHQGMLGMVAAPIRAFVRSARGLKRPTCFWAGFRC